MKETSFSEQELAAISTEVTMRMMASEDPLQIVSILYNLAARYQRNVFQVVETMLRKKKAQIGIIAIDVRSYDFEIISAQPFAPDVRLRYGIHIFIGNDQQRLGALGKIGSNTILNHALLGEAGFHRTEIDTRHLPLIRKGKLN